MRLIRRLPDDIDAWFIAAAMIFVAAMFIRFAWVWFARLSVINGVW